MYANSGPHTWPTPGTVNQRQWLSRRSTRKDLLCFLCTKKSRFFPLQFGVCKCGASINLTLVSKCKVHTS